jgi:hypothetical protein
MVGRAGCSVLTGVAACALARSEGPAVHCHRAAAVLRGSGFFFAMLCFGSGLHRLQDLTSHKTDNCLGSCAGHIDPGQVTFVQRSA